MSDEITPYLEELLASFLPDLLVYADCDPVSPHYDGLRALFDAGLIEWRSPGSHFVQISERGRQRLRRTYRQVCLSERDG